MLQGAWGLTFTSCWMAAYTLPNWRDLVTSEVDERHGYPPLILLLFFTHMINNAVHNAAWFIVCELESGVSTGLLMGVKAAALFLASALFFCDDAHREQCLTPKKSLATAIVLIGTAVYYWPTEPSCDTSACCAGGSATWLQCWRMPRRASTVSLRSAQAFAQHSCGADGAGDAPAGLAAAADDGLDSPYPGAVKGKRWRRRRKGGHAKLDEDGDDDYDEAGEERYMRGAEGGGGAVEAAVPYTDDVDAEGADGAADAAGDTATPCATTRRVSESGGGSTPPKLNGTPAPLSTPNDECARTPMEPMSRASSVAEAPSTGGAARAASRLTKPACPRRQEPPRSSDLD